MKLKHLLVLTLHICAVVCNESAVKNESKIEAIQSKSNETTTTPAAATKKARPSELNGEKKSRKVTSTDFSTKLNQMHNNNTRVEVAEGVWADKMSKNTSQLHVTTNLTSIMNITNTKTTAEYSSTPKPTTINTTSSTTSSTTTTTTTSTTTTTTTAKPKKPLFTHSVEDYPELVVVLHENNNKLNDDYSAPIPPETAPVRDASAQMHTDMFVPLITIMFTIPLAAGVLITTYRRFRDCWSTRHYRRMDFLVDGMYND